jgi:hypothetical protein
MSKASSPLSSTRAVKQYRAGGHRGTPQSTHKLRARESVNESINP